MGGLALRAGSEPVLPAYVSKLLGVFPAVAAFQHRRQAGVYYTLMMSTGLTFGTISALYGLSHGVVTSAQYSLLVAAVIASAVVPTVIANALFMPVHLRPVPAPAGAPAAGTAPAGGSA